MDASAKMETPSPTPSQPPSREMRVARISGSPPPGRGSRPPFGTAEMQVMAEGRRRPPIPESRRNMEMSVIREIVRKLSPNLSVPEQEELNAAAEAAENVVGISPKTEFIARLENGLFTLVLETYREMEK